MYTSPRLPSDILHKDAIIVIEWHLFSSFLSPVSLKMHKSSLKIRWNEFILTIFRTEHISSRVRSLFIISLFSLFLDSSKKEYLFGVLVSTLRFIYQNAHTYKHTIFTFTENTWLFSLPLFSFFRFVKICDCWCLLWCCKNKKRKENNRSLCMTLLRILHALPFAWLTSASECLKQRKKWSSAAGFFILLICLKRSILCASAIPF